MPFFLRRLPGNRTTPYLHSNPNADRRANCHTDGSANPIAYAITIGLSNNRADSISYAIFDSIAYAISDRVSYACADSITYAISDSVAYAFADSIAYAIADTVCGS